MKNRAFNNIILASASPRRKFLLEKAGMCFRVEVSGADELENGTLPPEKTAMFNALSKARAVAVKFPEEIVLGADTVVVLEERIFGKPKSVEDAADILRQLSAKTHKVITAIALVLAKSGKETTTYEESLVKFKELSDDTIRKYMSLVNVMDKAGAYGIQEHADMIIDKIDGNIDNVMGLPCSLVMSELERFKEGLL